MPPNFEQLAEELLSTLPWSIVLPAGCGKTELIAAIAATISSNQKPILVLTHTNAGVEVLRKRFLKYRVGKNQARVFTLDSWAGHFSEYFPLLGEAAQLPVTDNLWLIAKLRAKEIFKSPHVGDVIAATYSAILVDEYQDCSDLQHELIVSMSQHLPVGVLGDPLQGIFDFGEGVIDWAEVEGSFPAKSLPPTPYRWINSNPLLGNWLLEIRPRLIAGSSIDFSSSDVPVDWQESNWLQEGRFCHSAVDHIAENKQIIALRQQPAQCHKFAKNLSNKYMVAEELELNVAKKLMTGIDRSNGSLVAAETIKFVKACCVGLSSAFSRDLVNDYSRGNVKSYASRNSNADAFDSLNLLLTEPTVKNVLVALEILKSKTTRIFRHEAWYTTLKILEEARLSETSAMEKLVSVRNRRRYGGQNLVRHTVSRTLLVKGQECDECIILGADGMSARNLYVALSRGIDRVTVFSSNPVLKITTY